MYILNLEEGCGHKTNQTMIITQSKTLKWLLWNVVTVSQEISV